MGRPQAGFACLRPPLMSNVRALQTQFRSRMRSVCPRAHESSVSQRSSGVGSRLCIRPGFGQVRDEPVSPSSIRQDSQGSSELRDASDRQQHQPVVGAPRRRAAPGSQSMDLGTLKRSGTITSSRKRAVRSVAFAAVPGSGQLTCSSKRGGRVCWQSCASSSIALTLPSNGQSQAGFAHL